MQKVIAKYNEIDTIKNTYNTRAIKTESQIKSIIQAEESESSRVISLAESSKTSLLQQKHMIETDYTTKCRGLLTESQIRSNLDLASRVVAGEIQPEDVPSNLLLLVKNLAQITKCNENILKSTKRLEELREHQNRKLYESLKQIDAEKRQVLETKKNELLELLEACKTELLSKGINALLN